MKPFIISCMAVCFISTAFAQSSNPFKSIGKRGEIISAYNGRFVEDYDDDSIQRIGSVLINIHSRKITKLLNTDKVFAGHADNSGASRWYSVDPLAAKGKNISFSPYAFVRDNPVIYTDPDGRNAAKVIDDQNKTITIKAVYFVQTEKSFKNDLVMGYSAKDVANFNKNINAALNKLGLSVSEGDLKGYKVQFQLTFKEGGTLANAKELQAKEEINGVNVGNTLTKANGNIEYFKERVVNEETGETRTVGGVTDTHKYTTMNDNLDSRRNEIHEIFHTLFFDNDTAKKGIGSYGTSQMPNQADINTLVNNQALQGIPKVLENDE